MPHTEAFQALDDFGRNILDEASLAERLITDCDDRIAVLTSSTERCVYWAVCASARHVSRPDSKLRDVSSYLWPGAAVRWAMMRE